MLLFLVIRPDFFHGAYLCCGGSASRRKAHGEGLSLPSSLHWDRCTTTFLTMETIWQKQPVVIRHVWCRDLLILCCWIRCLILRYLVQLCQLTLYHEKSVFPPVASRFPSGSMFPIHKRRGYKTVLQCLHKALVQIYKEACVSLGDLRM